MSYVRSRLFSMLSEAIHSITDAEGLPRDAVPALELDLPKLPEHGDYSTNAAMLLTRILKRNPRQIATQLIENINDRDRLLEKMEIAGPGFINLFIRADGWHRSLRNVLECGADYGRQDIGRSEKIQVEFVSANPTGPLHIGHGRGSATGDCLAAILHMCGYQVEREYYINDAGNQMDTLGRSLYYRYREILGDDSPFPDDHYQGEYLIDLAREFLDEHGEKYREIPLDEALAVFTDYAGSRILAGIRQDLEDFGVTFDVWFSERSLHEDNAIEKAIAELEQRGFVYDSDGAKWFRSTDLGDEKDRVVVRANGISTYFASDLAYHQNKYERGFDRVIDVWGADHHGYVARMQAGVEAMGRRREDLQVVLVQLVNLLRAGKPVAMSTRAGEFVTLREVIDEVGKDASRFIFLTRRSDSHLDFDLEVAKMQSNDNPVYYVQYAHARLCSIFEVARERGIAFGPDTPFDPSPLSAPAELNLIKMLGEYPEVLANSARYLEPHRVTYYLHQLVSNFHSYYNHHRILGEDPVLTKARLHLAAGLRIVIKNALDILGVSAPEKM